jgi:hypothetical protein
MLVQAYIRNLCQIATALIRRRKLIGLLSKTQFLSLKTLAKLPNKINTSKFYGLDGIRSASVFTLPFLAIYQCPNSIYKT